MMRLDSLFHRAFWDAYAAGEKFFRRGTVDAKRAHGTGRAFAADERGKIKKRLWNFRLSPSGEKRDRSFRDFYIVFRLRKRNS